MTGRGDQSIDWAQARDRLARAARSLAAGTSDPGRIAAAFRERAAHLAVPHTASAGPAVECRAVVFRLGADSFAAPLLRVERIIPGPACTALPGATGRWAGVTIADGEVLPVLHLARILGLAEPDRPLERHVLKLRHRKPDCGLLVGTVLEIRVIPLSGLPPYRGNVPMIGGVAPGNVLLLDIESLIARELLP